MSLERRCDNCHEPIEDSSSNEKPIDCLILFGGDVTNEYEDLCPKCRKKLQDFLTNGFSIPYTTRSKEFSLPNVPLDMSKPIPSVTSEYSEVKQENNEKPPIQEPNLTPKPIESNYVPFSGVNDNELADSVTKRWSLPIIDHTK